MPIAELAVARVRGDEGIAVAWSHLSALPGEIRRISPDARRRPQSLLAANRRPRNRIALTGLSGFERALENESLIGAVAEAAGAAAS